MKLILYPYTHDEMQKGRNYLSKAKTTQKFHERARKVMAFQSGAKPRKH